MADDPVQRDECAKEYEFGNPPLTIDGSEFVVTNFSESNPTNTTDYTDGYGNHKCSIDTNGAKTASFTIQGEKRVDMDKIQNGVPFKYDGYNWRVRNRGKTRAVSSVVSLTFDAPRGKKIDAAPAPEPEGPENP